MKKEYVGKVRLNYSPIIDKFSNVKMPNDSIYIDGTNKNDFLRRPISNSIRYHCQIDAENPQKCGILVQTSFSCVIRNAVVVIITQSDTIM